MSKQVVLLTSGTRGDVIPYLALAVGLRKAGLDAVIATHEPFRGLVEEHEVPFRALSENPTDLLIKPGSMPLTYNGSLYRSLQASRKYMRAARPLFQKMLSSAWRACQGAGGILIGLPTFWGHSIAEVLQIPHIWCPLQPLTSTSSFPSVFQPFTFSLGPAYNRLTHWITRQIIWQVWRREINQWRTHLLGLPSLPFRGPYSQQIREHIPYIYGISPHVLQKPGDWPTWHVLAGYWFLDPSSDWTPPLELLNFLESGKPPVYIGFGSMENPDILENEIVQTAKEMDQRFIVSLKPNSLSRINSLHTPNVFAIQDIPHSWLFPRVRAAVHHGGAGTTAASLRAGIPTAIVPVGVDQFFWGNQIFHLGVGPKPVSQRKLNVGNIIQIVEYLTHQKQVQTKASILGKQIREEKGVENAVAEISAVLR